MLTEKLNQLFEEWQDEIADYKGRFIKDGIINEDEWLKTSTKILFIAKEANQYGKQTAGDFRADWKNNDSNYPFAFRIAEWSFGILNDFPVFDKIFPKSTYYHEFLQKISFLNIKKTGGVGNSNGGVIGQNVDRNQKFLLNEIQIISPDIIILCLSFDRTIPEKIFGQINWQSSGYDIKIARWKSLRLPDHHTAL